MVDNSALLFWKHPAADSPDIVKKILDPVKGTHLYFRRIKEVIQARLTDSIDHEQVPRVLVHGSAHIDNYAKTNFGEALIDFDRSCEAPYIWDVCCFLLSLSLRQENYADNEIDKKITDSFYEHYLQQLMEPSVIKTAYSYFNDRPIKSWEESTRAYLKAGKKWAKLLSKETLPKDDIFVNELLRQYLESRDALSLLESYKVKQAAFAVGTFDRERLLIVLSAKDKSKDKMIFDIKKAKGYAVPHLPQHSYYDYQCEHHARRLIIGSQHYAPHAMQQEGYATVNGIEFWGRQVPIYNAKIKSNLTVESSVEFASLIAKYLASGHARSVDAQQRKNIEQHFKQNYQLMLETINTIKNEIMTARDYYIEQAIK